MSGLEELPLAHTKGFSQEMKPEPSTLRLESFLFFLLFLIPAIGLDSMLSAWKSTADREQQDQVREQTTELLTRFEQVLDPASICRDSLMFV